MAATLCAKTPSQSQEQSRGQQGLTQEHPLPVSSQAKARQRHPIQGKQKQAREFVTDRNGGVKVMKGTHSIPWD